MHQVLINYQFSNNKFKTAMNFFNSKTVYNSGWEVTDRRKFEKEEIAMVKKCEVVPSQYGLSACFFMKSGGRTYVPMSRDSNVEEGDVIDLNKASILTLSRDGDNDIERIEI